MTEHLTPTAAFDALHGNDSDHYDALIRFYSTGLNVAYSNAKELAGFDYIGATFEVLLAEIARLKAQNHLMKDFVDGLRSEDLSQFRDRVRLTASEVREPPAEFLYVADQVAPGPGLSHLEQDANGSFRWLLGDRAWMLSARMRHSGSIGIVLAVDTFAQGVGPHHISVELNGQPCEVTYDAGTGQFTGVSTCLGEYFPPIIVLKVTSAHANVPLPDTRHLVGRLRSVKIFAVPVSLPEAVAVEASDTPSKATDLSLSSKTDGEDE